MNISEQLEYLIGEGMVFDVGEADPPWNYKADRGCHGGGCRRDPTRTDPRLFISPPYSLMKLDDIKALAPLIKRLFDPVESVMYLWVTNGFMEQGYEVLREWGFQPSGVVYTWVKCTKDGIPCNGRGTGRRARHDTEHCILGFRGGGEYKYGQRKGQNRGHVRGHDLVGFPYYGKKLHSTTMLAPQPRHQNGRIHSAKPDCIKRIAEHEYGTFLQRKVNPLPLQPYPAIWQVERWLYRRLEIFGCGDRIGWTVVGDGK